MSKRFLWLILALTGAAVLFFIGRNVSANSAGDPFSSEPLSNIGGWYDETWKASGFYHLEQVGAGTNFRYTYNNDPTSATTGVTPYNGALAAPDLVVTEWDVTGHVHFSSGL